MSSRSTRRFAADKIAKRINKVQKDMFDELAEDKSSSEAEESEFENDVSYNPSTLRDAEIPDVEFTSSKHGDLIDDGHAHFSDDDEDGDEEEEEGAGYSLDSGSDNDNDTDEDLMGVHDAEIDDLEAQLDLEDEEEEVDEGGELVSRVQRQREKDLKIAVGNKALQNQKKRILSLFLKIHPLIQLVNQLPPTSLDDEASFNPYSIAAEDEEIAQAFQEAAEAIDVVKNDFAEMKQTLSDSYQWDKEADATEKMLEIIAHWGQRLRQSSGMKSGSIINRPIEQQIAASLKDRETLVQPSRKVTEKRIYGVEELPQYLCVNYADDDFYDKQMREIIAEKNPEMLQRVRTSKPTKATLRSKQISYDVIPELQNYMSATMRPVPDTINAMLRSLMSSK